MGNLHFWKVVDYEELSPLMDPIILLLVLKGNLNNRRDKF